MNSFQRSQVIPPQSAPQTPPEFISLENDVRELVKKHARLLTAADVNDPIALEQNLVKPMTETLLLLSISSATPVNSRTPQKEGGSAKKKLAPKKKTLPKKSVK
jgi:hypothetical protein